VACNHIDLPGGGFAIVCGRGSRQRLCTHCGKPSDKLCDYPLRGAKEGQTCSRPVCQKCATHVEPDTDFCRTHAEMIEREGRTPAEVQAAMPKPVFGDPGWIKAKSGR
jgi:hypothetical protein